MTQKNKDLWLGVISGVFVYALVFAVLTLVTNYIDLPWTNSLFWVLWLPIIIAVAFSLFLIFLQRRRMALGLVLGVSMAILFLFLLFEMFGDL